MQLLIIKPDGEVHEIKEDKPFRELLSPNECYILNDDRKRVIYLWKGNSCSVRSKFIGASKSQEVRGQVGMHYKVIPIDEGDEPNEFLEYLDQKPEKGLAREIREEKELGFEVSAGSGEAPKSSGSANFGTVVDTPPPPQPKPIPKPQQAGPLYTGGSVAQAAAPKEDFNFKEIMETLEGMEIPAGYEREMVIIGNGAYSIIEKKVKFLGTEKIEKVMEKVSSLPEGVFFAEGYAPRVLCENQKVLAIEFLKKTDKGQKKLKPSSKDPKELAKSFGMNA